MTDISRRSFLGHLAAIAPLGVLASRPPAPILTRPFLALGNGGLPMTSGQFLAYTDLHFMAPKANFRITDIDHAARTWTVENIDPRRREAPPKPKPPTRTLFFAGQDWAQASSGLYELSSPTSRIIIP